MFCVFLCGTVALNTSDRGGEVGFPVAFLTDMFDL